MNGEEFEKESLISLASAITIIANWSDDRALDDLMATTTLSDAPGKLEDYIKNRWRDVVVHIAILGGGKLEALTKRKVVESIMCKGERFHVDANGSIRLGWISGNPDGNLQFDGEDYLRGPWPRNPTIEYWECSTEKSLEQKKEARRAENLAERQRKAVLRSTIESLTAKGVSADTSKAMSLLAEAAVQVRDPWLTKLKLDFNAKTGRFLGNVASLICRDNSSSEEAVRIVQQQLDAFCERQFNLAVAETAFISVSDERVIEACAKPYYKGLPAIVGASIQHAFGVSKESADARLSGMVERCVLKPRKSYHLVLPVRLTGSS